MGQDVPLYRRNERAGGPGNAAGRRGGRGPLLPQHVPKPAARVLLDLPDRVARAAGDPPRGDAAAAARYLALRGAAGSALRVRRQTAQDEFRQRVLDQPFDGVQNPAYRIRGGGVGIHQLSGDVFPDFVQVRPL